MKTIYYSIISLLFFGYIISLPVNEINTEESDEVKQYRKVMENPDMFEGDIYLGPDRNAVPTDTQKWPGGVIHYVIDQSVKDLTYLINDVIDYYNEHTCIRWKPRTNQSDYVKFFKQLGCWSKVGRWGGEQQISLGLGCNRFSIIFHEMMHATGFWHEQSRSDRDDFVQVHWENIALTQRHNFNILKKNQNRIFTTFDFDSIMLYGPTAFSTNGKPTLTSKVPGKKIISRPTNKPPSNLDLYSLNKLYYCLDYLNKTNGIDD